MSKTERETTDRLATLKLQDGARAVGLPPKEFRTLLARLGIEVLRPSERRERIRQEDMEQLCRKIAGPAHLGQREGHAA